MARPRTVVTTSSCCLLLIYQPQKDERLSWPSWLTYSGRFTVGRVQDSESSPVKNQRSTAATWNQPLACLSTIWQIDGFNGERKEAQKEMGERENKGKGKNGKGLKGRRGSLQSLQECPQFMLKRLQTTILKQ